MFLKPRSALIADGEAIERPAGYERVDFEGELGVVIGQRARRVPRERALEVVLGFTCINDVSVSRSAEEGRPVDAREGLRHVLPARAADRRRPGSVDAATRSRASTAWCSRTRSTSDLIFDVPTLIAFASEHMTLEVGDVISTGTPSGVGNLSPGDVVEIEIEGIGVLRNRVVARG